MPQPAKNARTAGVDLVGPVQPNRRRGTRGADAFDTDDFAIDWETLTTTCPHRSQCTKAKANGRTLTLRPREEHELLLEQRRVQQTDAWKTRYTKRSDVEGTISQATRAFVLRECRCRGHAKTALQHVLIATAANLARLDAWLNGRPLGKTRVSHLAALAPTT